jgi:FKBP-type peptidyl-prolyl cis-trans isomerase SlyD
MKISGNKAVTISYTLRNAGGDILDQATTEQPLAYLHGVGMMLPDFEAALEGKTVGNMVKPVLSPEQGYGVREEQAIMMLGKEIFAEAPAEIMVVGNTLHMQDQNGNPVPGTIVEITDEGVRMDFNHPLAGVELHFEVMVLEVRDATQEELAHGHVHGVGGHQH